MKRPWIITLTNHLNPTKPSTLAMRELGEPKSGALQNYRNATRSSTEKKALRNGMDGGRENQDSDFLKQATVRFQCATLNRTRSGERYLEKEVEMKAVLLFQARHAKQSNESQATPDSSRPRADTNIPRDETGKSFRDFRPP